MLVNIKCSDRGIRQLQVRGIVPNLIDTYGQIDQHNLRINKAKLYKAWYTSLICENLIP